MFYSRYIFSYMILGGITLAEPTKVDNPSQCMLLCKKESCQNNPSLAESCQTVCKRTTFYKKILQACGRDVEQEAPIPLAESQVKSAETPSLPLSYRERKQKAKEQEFAAALSKSQGKRLANITIEEMNGFIRQGGLVGETITLSPKGIFMVLQKINVISSMKDPDDASNALKIEKKEPGFHSDQLYIVTIKPSYLKSPDLATTYVIKRLKKDSQKILNAKENDAKKELQDLDKVKDFIVPQLQGTNVHIATGGGACWYFDSANEKRYIIVLNIAPGKSLEDWGAQYLKGLIDESKWNHIMKSVGAAIGKIHYTLASPQTKHDLQNGVMNWKTFKTTIHGDFHNGNIFSDGLDETTLIDAAAMAETFNEGDKHSPLQDIADLYLHAKYILYFNNAKGAQWVDDGFNAFVDGYASAFPKINQEAVHKAVHQKYQEWSEGIFEHIQKHGYAAYRGPDSLWSQILPDIISKLKSARLKPVDVIRILRADIRGG